MNANERYRNAKGTLLVWGTALTVAGTPTMLGRDQPVTVSGPAVRWSVEPVDSSMVAVNSADFHTMRNRLLLIADLFWPAPSDDGTVGLYDMDDAVDDLRDAMTLISRRFVDYTTVPGTPSNEGFAHQLRTLGPPQLSRLSSDSGYTRARVTATVTWDAYHQA